ncbi:peptidase family M50-domain-containing protein [Obelidium mucronatum]|nr:peptidase family M50-domain-containing protein [Obelidium mucronatum]
MAAWCCAHVLWLSQPPVSHAVSHAPEQGAVWHSVSLAAKNRSLVYSSGPNLESPTNGRFLVSLIPGVNLPLYAIGYYFAALLLAGVFHELGHAIAATVEQVPMRNAGIFVSVIFPGAFVDLNESSLMRSSATARLRIICAGVWHNFVFAGVSLLALSTLPYWLSWGYRDLQDLGHAQDLWKGGVVALDIDINSPLHESVDSGTVFMSIDDTPIFGGVNSWESALVASLTNSTFTRQGYCVSKQAVSRNAHISCCDVNEEYPLGETSSMFQCFLPQETVNQRSSIQLSNDTLEKSAKACLNLDSVIHTASTCTLDSDCLLESSDSQSNSICMSAYIPNRYIRIVRLHVLDIWKRRDIVTQTVVKELDADSNPTDSNQIGNGRVASDGSSHRRRAFTGGLSSASGTGIGKHHLKIPVRTILYLGDPREISESVRVGSLYPKLHILPLSLPYKLERMLHFLISFNVALSIMNMIPAFDMDGYHALSALFDVFIEHHSYTTTNASGGGSGRGMRSMLGRIGTAKLRIYKDRSLKLIGRICTFLFGVLIVVSTLGAIL